MVQPLVEPILHPSRWRIRALGLSTAVGHPMFYFFWTQWLPQPYERLWQRLAMSALGVTLLVVPALSAQPPSRRAAYVYTTIFWITLPFFFTWMYFCNQANAVWLAALGAMFLIYYHLTDWRIATLGSISGLACGWLAYLLFGPGPVPLSPEHWATHAIVLAFCWYMGLALGISSSNLQREQLNYTLGTVGIMAHELRTPLATMALIGEAVRSEAALCGRPASASQLERLATRLATLVRNMNHQIDTQIANARLLHLPNQSDLVQAPEVVAQAVAEFPYRSTRERDCVVVRVHQAFSFRGSQALFHQVVDNLLKNALRSLAAASTAPRPGDLLIEVGVMSGRGRIVVSDKGVGMSEALRSRLFQPFVSTDRGTGHGLGLAFCQRVVQAAGGTIRVKSARLAGAIFTIELPLAA